jgi:hypothetical protein
MKVCENVTHHSHYSGRATPPEHTEREAGLDVVWSAANLPVSGINPGSNSHSNRSVDNKATYS